MLPCGLTGSGCDLGSKGGPPDTPNALREKQLLQLLETWQRRQESIALSAAAMHRSALDSLEDLRGLGWHLGALPTLPLLDERSRSTSPPGSARHLSEKDALKMTRALREELAGISSPRRVAPHVPPPAEPSMPVGCAPDTPVVDGCGAHWAAGDVGDRETSVVGVDMKTSGVDVFASGEPVQETGAASDHVEQHEQMKSLMSFMESGMKNSTHALGAHLEEANQTKHRAPPKNVIERTIANGFTSIMTGMQKGYDLLPDFVKNAATEGTLATFLRSTFFGEICAFMIISNAVFIGFSTQYAIDNLAKPSTNFIDAVELAFHSYYLLELILKLAVMRLTFILCEDWKWNLFDAFLVSTAVYDVYTMLVGMNALNVTFLRAVRLVRMMKILRVVRVLQHCRELRLMLSAIMGSVTSLFWCLIMLACVLYLCSLIFVQAVTGFLGGLEDGTLQADDDIVVKSLLYYGSLIKASDTMFRAITGGNDWGELSEPIMAAGLHYYCLFVLCICFLTLAVLNILTGIFCANAVEAAESDRENITYMAAKQCASFKDDCRELFMSIDDDGSGTINHDEFSRHMCRPEILAYLGALELEIADAEMFFRLMSQNSPHGEVDIAMFLDGCLRLKGNAKMLDVQAMRCQLTCIFSMIRHLTEICDRHARSEGVIYDPASAGG